MIFGIFDGFCSELDILVSHPSLIFEPKSKRPHHRLQRIIDTADGSLIGSIHLFHETDSQSSFGAPQRVSSRGFKIQIKYTYSTCLISTPKIHIKWYIHTISYYIIVFMMFRTCISNLASILIVTVTSSLASYSNQVLNRCQLCIYKKAKECIWYTTGRFSEWRIGNPWLLGKQRNGVSFWILLSWATPTMRLRCFCRALLLNVKFALSHPEQRDVKADRIGFHI